MLAISVGGYFLLLLGAFLVVLVQHFGHVVTPGSAWAQVLTLAFSLGACAVCWELIGRFMAAVAAEKGCGKDALALLDCTSPSWMEFDVFVQAYVDVTKDPAGWLMSCQLLMFVQSACTFLLVETRARGIPRYVALSYVILGFLGAISLAFPLAFLHIFLLRGQRKAGAPFPSEMAGCAAIGVACVAVLPQTWDHYRRSYYTYALMTLHGILALPLALPQREPQSARKDGKSLAVLYLLLAGASAMFHLINFVSALAVFDGKLERVWGGAWGTICQQSISFDVCFSSVACCAYMIAVDSRRGLLATAATPFFSIAATFPFFLAFEVLCPEEKQKRV